VASRRLIGYWRSEAEPQWPDPVEFVDAGWDDEERKNVALYLASGARSASTMNIPVALGWSSCRICGKDNGFGELVDGSYLWPEGLAHYVGDHSVRLPREFIDHVRQQQADRDDSDLSADWWRSVRPD
jgi:hypothetical protein